MSNRVIKFRAWDGERMFESDYNPDVNDDSREYYPFCFWIGYKGRKDITLMQFTGLLDKEGKEIYEGDIWERNGFLGQIVFEFSGWGIRTIAKSNSIQYPSFYSNAVTGVVIGNIYQHSDILSNESK